MTMWWGTIAAFLLIEGNYTSNLRSNYKMGLELRRTSVKIINKVKVWP